MVTRSDRKGVTGDKEQKRGRVKVGKLTLKKETVKGLSNSETRKIKGGQRARGSINCNLTEFACGAT